ncbi:hypothetical protein EYF80_059194 [Liparis tanakae]|uniref:Uncharacterized protein n=1 Tax=Liparis tanakae TaxID=230148 RepID=A0A4Z2EPD3_9TELE|nr:hypothetical protein EYF80_059194 [Liparis tanakae]
MRKNNIKTSYQFNCTVSTRPGGRNRCRAETGARLDDPSTNQRTDWMCNENWTQPKTLSRKRGAVGSV